MSTLMVLKKTFQIVMIILSLFVIIAISLYFHLFVCFVWGSICGFLTVFVKDIDDDYIYHTLDQ